MNNKRALETDYICRLCHNHFSYREMSEEHYPAKSVGNNDVIALDIVKAIDSLQSGLAYSAISQAVSNGTDFHEATGEFFDCNLAIPLYPRGRTIRTLCKACNTFLGVYDQAYLRFFNEDGNEKVVRGFQQRTKLNIIKAIYGKFLSVPEALEEEFDFIGFIRDQTSSVYDGKWNLYFVHRDSKSDLMAFRDIGTGKAEFDEGVVYELSDDKFIYNLMNFRKHDCYVMNNIFDILEKNYKLVNGVGDNGGYHAQILISRLLRNPS